MGTPGQSYRYHQAVFGRSLSALTPVTAINLQLLPYYIILSTEFRFLILCKSVLGTYLCHLPRGLHHHHLVAPDLRTDASLSLSFSYGKLSIQDLRKHVLLLYYARR